MGNNSGIGNRLSYIFLDNVCSIHTCNLAFRRKIFLIQSHNLSLGKQGVHLKQICFSTHHSQNYQVPWHMQECTRVPSSHSHECSPLSMLRSQCFWLMLNDFRMVQKTTSHFLHHAYFWRSMHTSGPCCLCQCSTYLVSSFWSVHLACADLRLQILPLNNFLLCLNKGHWEHFVSSLNPDCIRSA